MAMLRIDLRQVQGAPVETVGTLDPADPALDGLQFTLAGPVDVAGTLRRTEEDDFYWRGQLRARVVGECRRCLGAVEQLVDEPVEVVYSGNPDLLEDPSVYPLDAKATAIELAGAIREELVLRVSAFPLCRPECKGLCVTCGADLNAGPCACTAPGSTN